MNNKKVLILEVYHGSKLTKLNEAQENVPEGMMRVSGVFAVVGVKNRNGRVYDKENYKKHLALLQDDIIEGLYGELEHPEGYTINNNNISHKVEAVWFDEATNEVKGTLLLLDTEKGKIAQSIIRSGGSLRVSSRASGSVDNKSNATIDKLVTFDIVGTPGFKQTNLHLSENMTLLSSDNLCESFVLNLNNKMISNNSQNFNEMNKNQALLEARLKALQGGNRMNESGENVTRDFLLNKFAPGIQKWLFEEFSPVVMNWVIDDFAPVFETYMRGKALNESVGKTSCSFAAYAKMKMNEAMQQQEPENGTIVLSEQEQQAVNKLQKGDQLTEEEQEQAEQGLQKMQQKCKQRKQMKESQVEPENGTVVLTEEEQQVVDKLQQGETLNDEELKQAEQAIKKMQQQQQQKPAQQVQKQQLKESLTRKLNVKNRRLSESYRKLMEAEDDEQEEINKDIEQLKQDVENLQNKIDDLDESQQDSQFQQAVQKLQQGEELTDDDVSELTQDQIEQLLDQQENQQEVGQQKSTKQNEGFIPESDEAAKSLLEKESSKVINKSASLLESISQRMNNAGIGKKK